MSYIDSCFGKTRSDDGFSRMQSPSDDVSTDPVVIECLVDCFFQRVHEKNPILNQDLVSSYFREYCHVIPLYDDKTCLVLLIGALGAVATQYTDEESIKLDNPERAESLRLGRCYFEAAQRRLGTVISSPGIISAQCLCLSGIYHMYIIEPISALHMFHTAGTSIKLAQDTSDTTAESQHSVFWACLKSERELLAELPIMNPALTEYPPYDHYPSPPAQSTSDQPTEWTTLERESWY
ncbi:hypothetical protein BJX66DRAFT_340793 [Aspergillus keveii]|uniref:Transcription factor domain-containing protein n=1 Tax=Aspergillus keveii TaxID=714993 RepID=A0ABR4FXE5_9EURO